MMMTLVLSTLLMSAADERGTVTRVVVFADRAEVTRRVTARCENGSAEAKFFPLPLGIDTRTLRGETAAPAKVIGASSREVPLEVELDKRVDEAKTEIRKIEARLRELEDLDQTADSRGRTLSGYEAYFRAILVEAIRDPKPDPKKWAETINAIEKERLELASASLVRFGEHRKLARSRDVMMRKLAQLTPSNVKSAREVVVAAECGGAAQLGIELNYVIGGATWHPEYDLAFDAQNATGLGAGRAQLTVGAIVQQSTGEDWRGVELVLSTAKPKLGSEAPVPRPLFISGYEEQKQKVMVQAQERREELQGGKSSGADLAQATVLEDRGQSFTLTIPGRANVASDGRPYWMPVEVVAVDAEARLVTIPKLRPYVYRVAKLVNPAKHPLIAGKLHTHRGGSYVGDAWLEYKGIGEPIEASLGIDEELRVERKSLIDMSKGPGFLSGTQHLEQGWRIMVENKSRAGVTVEVKENIPVSKDEKIEVEIQKSKTTASYKLDANRGFMTWQVQVPKGGRATVDLMHTIHLPKDWKVQ